MREIRIPRRILLHALTDEATLGHDLLYPVQVDWPEVQLTEEQINANAWALVNGHPLPHPDQSIFLVRLERW